MQPYLDVFASFLESLKQENTDRRREIRGEHHAVVMNIVTFPCHR